MSIVDNALATRGRQGRPIRVGMIGAGFMGARVALFGDEVPSLAGPVLKSARSPSATSRLEKSSTSMACTRPTATLWMSKR